MNVLIGGTGFIGSALLKRLVKDGEEVVSISRTGRGEISGVRYVACDVTDRERLREIVAPAKDVFILTGQIGPEFDELGERKNLENIARMLVPFPEKRVFYVSSVYVYGNTDTPANEEFPPHPIENYSKFKLEAERILRQLLPESIVVIFRLANVYGSPKNRGIVGLAMKKLFEPDGKPLIINGDGSQKRDYIFLDDVAEALVMVKRQCVKSDTVNIATGESVSLLPVLDIISKVSGKEIPSEVSNIFPDEIRDMYISNEKLKNVYGYESKTSFEGGIQKTLERYQEFFQERLKEVSHFR
jgi:UDP-glucose 4-epimerase